MIWSHALRFSASLTLVASMTAMAGRCHAGPSRSCLARARITPLRSVSKDADAGFRALSVLLDPALDPSGEDEKVSTFKRLFPDRTTLILSGDTGNGIRSYDMLWSDLSLTI